MQIPEYRWPSFRIALYQFVMPVVDILSDGTKIRLHEPFLLHKPDLTILTNLCLNNSNKYCVPLLTVSDVRMSGVCTVQVRKVRPFHSHKWDNTAIM